MDSSRTILQSWGGRVESQGQLEVCGRVSAANEFLI